MRQRTPSHRGPRWSSAAALRAASACGPAVAETGRPFASAYASPTMRNRRHSSPTPLSVDDTSYTASTRVRLGGVRVRRWTSTLARWRGATASRGRPRSLSPDLAEAGEGGTLQAIGYATSRDELIDGVRHDRLPRSHSHSLDSPQLRSILVGSRSPVRHTGRRVASCRWTWVRPLSSPRSTRDRRLDQRLAGHAGADHRGAHRWRSPAGAGRLARGAIAARSGHRGAAGGR